MKAEISENEIINGNGEIIEISMASISCNIIEKNERSMKRRKRK
jgi:hypothetical protein